MASNMTSEGSSYGTTIGGYVAVAAVGLAVYYSTQRNKKRAGPQSARAPKVAEPRKDKKNAKKQRVEQFAQDAAAQEAAPQKPAGSKTYANAAALPKQKVGGFVDDDADELDNKEFAKQLSSLKEGKKFDAKSGKETKKQKSVKQSRAKKHEEKREEKTEDVASAPSSTAGIDADDDQSSTAESAEALPAGVSSVEDMLEVPSAGPSSLRITAPEFEQVKRGRKEKKAPEPELTKKQRQNRKKAEAAKLASQEAEKERKVKLEAQRRLARISEGRAAKDGSQSMAAANGKSAWAGGKPNGLSAQSPAASKPTSQPAPLDTFTDSAPAAEPKADNWIAAVPSEERQMELLKSETEAEEWSTVTSSKAKKGKKTSKAASTASEKVEESSDNAFVKPTKTAKAPQPAQKATTAPTTNGKPALTKAFGSFSALSTDEPEEVEEEWDV